ncbi:hypothetical protein [Cellulomonas denverensis]|uniref:Uncharacterized protein n=2 Tax=Cellulomonas denverensis TaxID=264297 RepID=A0A7X6QZH6_9CELL|nr:hypothetical protein [Cellulomonas denverensis]NKY23096.1 hypothetical protein [Cellulomonas denverensis]GIG23823.1 hypothetical protein Cde04nite_00670 [Cellulomonas denverensis]
MNRRDRLYRVAPVAVLALCAGSLTAQALWSDRDDGASTTMPTGAVSFAAQAADATTPVVSTDGGPVTLTLPGSEIIRVLDQTGPDPDPVFWRFTMSGAALGITGLAVDVRLDSTVDRDGTVTDISAGTASPSTVLGGSVVKVYPAAAGGDCSAVPVTPAGQEDRNVVIYDGDGYQLQAAGTNAGGSTRTQEWCVAMDWIDDPDGVYANQVQATAVGMNGEVSTAIADWSAVVAFPRSLHTSGDYVNEASVIGTGADGSRPRDEDGWHAVLFPDPSAEPSVVITLDPAVTNLNPSVATGDQPSYSATP